MRAALIFLCVVALAYCEYTTFTFTTKAGYAGNNIIYYTPSDEFFSLGAIENPIYIQMNYQNGTSNPSSSVCLNAYQSSYPTPGNNLAHACPDGGYAVVANNNVTTGGSSKLKFSRKNTSLRGQFLSKMVEDDTVPANSQPVYTYMTSGLNAGFTVTIDGSDVIEFTITVSGYYCNGQNEFPTGNGACGNVGALTTDGNPNFVTIPGNSSVYLTITTPKFDSTVVNSVLVQYNSTEAVYIQEGYLPNPMWYITSGISTASQTINTPGTFNAEDVFYVALTNSNDGDVVVQVNVNLTVCDDATLIGPNCAVNITASNTTDGTTVIGLSATLSGVSGGWSNDGNAWELDLSDSDDVFAYFQLIDLPTFDEQPNDGLPYYVRVSVGNTDLEDDDENLAPDVYAKLNGIPSQESYDYFVSGSVANQLVLQVNDPATDEWFIAVVLPDDFSIWVGVNCAGNCSDNSHGSCECGLADGTTVDCQSLVNSTYIYPLYEFLPLSTAESSGSCSCSDSDYALSYDCSQKSSPTVLFIVLIVIGGLIILFVAIGVPLYCYLSNKRKERYERI